jgi:predicted transposase YdaD
MSGYVSELRSKGREEGREEGRQEGRAQGRVRSILQVLDRRGVAVDGDSRERIESCTDADKLSTWLDRALTATKATGLFDPE